VLDPQRLPPLPWAIPCSHGKISPGERPAGPAVELPSHFVVYGARAEQSRGVGSDREDLRELGHCCGLVCDEVIGRVVWWDVVVEGVEKMVTNSGQVQEISGGLCGKPYLVCQAKNCLVGGWLAARAIR
jgi:hypothetical protein